MMVAAPLKKEPQFSFAGLERRIPASTYRLQLHKGFRFIDAQRATDYLNRLGLTACYASPILKAKPGSMHGYDICDHSVLNPELGSNADFAAWSRELHRRNMGLVLDVVPNHMSVDPDQNPWWRDVLENGSVSLYADYFDIDWEPLKSELHNKILLPMLTDQYGRVLERGELRLSFDHGALSLHVGGQTLPISPDQSARVYRRHLDQLSGELKEDNPDLREFLSILSSLDHLPPITETDPVRREERHRENLVARDRLARLTDASPKIRQHIEAAVRDFNGKPGDAKSFDALHELLEAQAYRLSYWKTASHEINYRRFFDVDQLAGVRMENPEVFQATHRLVLKLLVSGMASGLRIDHPDGLFDPAGYFEAVQEAYLLEWLRAHQSNGADLSEEVVNAVRAWRVNERKRDPQGLAAKPLYLLAEKILSADEALLPHWALHGTSGYDFLNDVNGLFIDNTHEDAFKKLYAAFTGQPVVFNEIEYTCKKLIMSTSMSSELNVLAHALNRISEGDRRSRDFTLDSLLDALKEVIACFPVYRTYINPYRAGASDRALIHEAVEEAKRRNPATESSIFDFIREVLLPENNEKVPPEEFQRQVAFTMKFQQYTGPVQAKAVEDTAFYRYNVLCSLNEVGGDPDRFGLSPADFHALNVKRRQNWPYSMLTSSTHDTKRGEDARARLNVLSEIPDEWERALHVWSAKANAFRSPVGRACLPAGRAQAPDRLDEYFIYQTLIAVWPTQESAEEWKSVSDRLSAYLLKAIKEAKRHTSWIRPNEAYENAVEHFIRSLMGSEAADLLSLMRPFARKVARAGMLNSLSQLTVKLASPGVPDFYQGTELWDLSLVDPDNRRPVDYAKRADYLTEMEPWLARGDRSRYVQDLLQHWEDGRIKMFLTLCGLRLRRAQPDLFLDGAYVPLAIEGEKAAHVVAWMRTYGPQAVIAIAPRLMTGLNRDNGLPVGEAAWGDTTLELPTEWVEVSWVNAVTNETLEPSTNRRIRLADLLRVCPTGLWTAAKR